MIAAQATTWADAAIVIAMIVCATIAYVVYRLTGGDQSSREFWRRGRDD